MTTTNTEYTWYWYVRLVEDRGYIGIVDENGDATDTASLTIQIWGDQLPDEVTATSDVLPIPAEYELGFIKGCVNEILQMDGKSNNYYEKAYQNSIEGCKRRRVQESEQPLVLKPLDLRDD